MASGFNQACYYTRGQVAQKRHQFIMIDWQEIDKRRQAIEDLHVHGYHDYQS